MCVSTYESTRRHKPEQHRENLKCHMRFSYQLRGRATSGAKSIGSYLRADNSVCVLAAGIPLIWMSTLLVKLVFDAIETFYEISSSHDGEYDVQSCLLGYTAV
jgi:hypothetical protein